MTGIVAVLHGGGDTVKLLDHAIDDLQPSPAAASATYTINSNGKVQYATSTGSGDLENWVVPAGNSGLYEVFATLNSGSLDSGSTLTWLPLSVTRSWNAAIPGAGNQAADLTMQLRLAASGVILATAHVTLHVNSS